MTLPFFEASQAPTDMTEPQYEHSMALSGLGPQRLLLALGFCEWSKSISSIVTVVDHLIHEQAISLNRDSILSLGVDAWKNCSSSPSMADIIKVTILDPRNFVQQFHEKIHNTGSESRSILAACFLIRERIDAYVEELDIDAKRC